MFRYYLFSLEVGKKFVYYSIWSDSAADAYNRAKEYAARDGGK